MTVAKALAQKYAADAPEWQAGKVNLATIKDWVTESDKLAKDMVYGPLWSNRACEVDLEQARITLSEDYGQQAGLVVEKQLAKAGYRLAAVLNRALGN
jgi:S1/P1 Nuclease